MDYDVSFSDGQAPNNLNPMTDVSQLFDGVPSTSNQGPDLSQLFDETPAPGFSQDSDREVMLAKIDEINQKYQARIDELLKEKDEMIKGIVGDLFASKTNEQEPSMANEVARLFD